jgi:hypothetical protein
MHDSGASRREVADARFGLGGADWVSRVMEWSSKWLAQKSRTFQPITPREFDRLGNPDPHACHDLGFCRARIQRDRRSIQGQCIMRVGDPERLRHFARTRAERSLIVQFPPAPHGGNPMRWLKRADQNRARRTRLLADEIDAPMNAIGAIDIRIAGRTEHYLVARRGASKRMGGRIGVVIRLNLDDDAADTVHQERRSDKIGGDLMHAPREERAFERFAELLVGCGSVLGHSAGMVGLKG